MGQLTGGSWPWKCMAWQITASWGPGRRLWCPAAFSNTQTGQPAGSTAVSGFPYLLGCVKWETKACGSPDEHRPPCSQPSASSQSVVALPFGSMWESSAAQGAYGACWEVWDSAPYRLHLACASKLQVLLHWWTNICTVCSWPNLECLEWSSKGKALTPWVSWMLYLALCVYFKIYLTLSKSFASSGVHIALLYIQWLVNERGSGSASKAGVVSHLDNA